MKKSGIYFLGIALLVIACNGTNENNSITKYSFESIELFKVIYGKPLISFQIDSTGKIIEFVKYPNKTRVYSYSLDKAELDSLKNYLSLAIEYEEPVEDKFSGCVDGVSYNLTINTKDTMYVIENTICDNKNIVDEMALFVLDISETKNKKLLFKNLLEYEKIIKNADSILNLGL
jgi:hypothetical protein